MMLAFVRASLPSTSGRARRRQRAGSPGSASRRRSSCGTGRRRSARRPARWTAGAISTSSARSRRLCPFRSRSATTPPPPARRNSSSARAGAIATSSISSSARSSAAASCSTARCFPAAPATPARSARCRSCARARSGAPQLIACASIYQLERRLEARRPRPFVDLARRPTPGANSARHLDGVDREAAQALAYAFVAAMSVIDVEAVVIDGAMPAAVRQTV